MNQNGYAIEAGRSRSADLVLGRLVITSGPSAWSTISVASGPHLVGRHPAADIRLDDITVSLRHAVIEQVDGALVITDVGSLNGTYVNGRRIDRSSIFPGDQLRVGTFHLSVLPASISSAA